MATIIPLFTGKRLKETITLPPEQYPRMVVNVLVFAPREHQLRVLLTPAPDRQGWALPGVPVQPEESLESTAGREVSRLLGGRETYLEQLYTYGNPARVAGQREISVVYFALVPASASASLDQDEIQAQWFPVDALPPLAADYGEMVTYGLVRLRYKIEYSAIGFQLLPEEFTLSELQKTYEMVLGEQLDKRNFRRRILEAGIIEPTTRMRAGGEGRPAQLYRYRPDAVAEVKARRLFP